MATPNGIPITVGDLAALDYAAFTAFWDALGRIISSARYIQANGDRVLLVIGPPTPEEEAERCGADLNRRG